MSRSRHAYAAGTAYPVLRRTLNKMLERREFLTGFSCQPAPTAGYWLHVNRRAMACRFEVTLPLWEQAGVRMAQQALNEADRLEAQLTIFRESSEVSFINRNAALAPVPVEPSLFALLLQCQELDRATEGAFDITSGALSRCWGFLRRQGRIPAPDELEAARMLVGGDKLLLDQEARTIRFTRAGVRINLGSIGKGYALDCIAALLRGRMTTTLLSAGSSSLRALGNGADERGWMVGVRHPRYQDRRLAVVRLRDCALSTSGNEEQFFEYEGKRYGHIIDPRSGWPAQQVAGVTVIAESAAVTDALATAFYVGGAELAERYCAAHPEVLVLLLASNAEQPLIIGHNSRCEVEIVNE